MSPEAHRPIQVKDNIHQSTQRMLDIIKLGEFTDHPEVEQWWGGAPDPLSKDYTLIRKNIFHSPTPENSLTDCCDIKLADVAYPLHFHAGLGDKQKRRIFEVMEEGVTSVYSNEEPTDPHTVSIFNRAVILASLLLKDKINPDTLEKLKAAQKEEIPGILKDLASETIQLFKDITQAQEGEHSEHEHHHYDDDHDHHDHDHRVEPTPPQPQEEHHHHVEPPPSPQPQEMHHHHDHHVEPPPPTTQEKHPSFLKRLIKNLLTLPKRLYDWIINWLNK